MIYLNLPVGGAHGWGVCGMNISLEMSRLTPTQLLTESFTADHIGDDLSYIALHELLPPSESAQHFLGPNNVALDGPLLQLANKQLRPLHAKFRGPKTLGYTFFEDTELLPSHIESGKRHFDQIATG